MIFKLKTLRDKVARLEQRMEGLRDDFDDGARPDYARKLAAGSRQIAKVWDQIAAHPGLTK